MNQSTKGLRRTISALAIAVVSIVVVQQVVAQDQPDQDDPPSRVAGVGGIQGSG